MRMVLNNCLNCNIKLKSKLFAHNHKFCSPKCRRKIYYLNNKNKIQKRNYIYKKNNKDYYNSYSTLYYLKFHKNYPKKFKNFENAKEYNKYWREKNLKLEKLSDYIKWRLKTTIPIKIIKKHYSSLKKIKL